MHTISAGVHNGHTEELGHLQGWMVLALASAFERRNRS